MIIIDVVLVFLSLILLILTLFFTIECIVGLYAKNKHSEIDNLKTFRSVILIPAHNEATVIKETIMSVQAQMTSRDKIIVIADNCTDDTANIVRRLGHDVLERNDDRRGKGYALAYGIDSLRLDCPDIVVIIDADCTIADNCLALLKHKSMQEKNVVQGCYLMHAGPKASIGQKISQFAILVKNKVRMQGLNKVIGNVPLLGSGMAFPWAVIKDLPLASGEIVEDMFIGINMLLNKNYCLYEPNAYINSPLPVVEKAQTGQRQRWEHGHIDLIQRLSPVLFMQAIQQKRSDLFLALLDLCILPLSLLILLHVAILFVALTFLLSGTSSLAVYIMITSLLLLGLTVITTWWFVGRDILTIRDFIKIPNYIISKLSIYTRFFVNKQTVWVKTKRK